MRKIDPRLKFLKESEKEELIHLEVTRRFAVEAEKAPSPKVRVLLQYKGDLAKIEKAGFETSTVAGDIATGMVDLKKLDKIAALDEVVMIESSRPLHRELDVSVPETRADLVHAAPPGYRGAGVIVGMIDSGIDYQHECFRRPDGTSRILYIWDQTLAPQGGESHPAGYSYGVEYAQAQINSAFSSSDPLSVVRHKDTDTFSPYHGTHTTGIAAGDGSAPGKYGPPAFTYVGVAPEADIIMVANYVIPEALGDSAYTLDAVNYIFSKAQTLGKPAVINLSQGDNLGPHDGTSLLERGIDNLLGPQGRAMVKSAGNEGATNRHASGTVMTGGAITLPFVVLVKDISYDTIDIWYPGIDRLGITLTIPGGSPTAVVNPGDFTVLTLTNGNRAIIDSRLDDPNNHDNRIYITLDKGTASAIQSGTWSLILHGTMVTDGRFDAWIERGANVPSFIGSTMNNARTISIPGTSHKIISVASYLTKPNTGNISSFSSVGPTRDGRQKPEIAAPGEWIMSSLGYPSDIEQYRLMAGTSMAAPHVTGVIALMFQRSKTLTQEQIRDCLTKNARTDANTGATPNNSWGFGKLDAKKAFDCVAPKVCMLIKQVCLKKLETCKGQKILTCSTILENLFCKKILETCTFQKVTCTQMTEVVCKGANMTVGCGFQLTVPPGQLPSKVIVAVAPAVLATMDPAHFEVIGQVPPEAAAGASEEEAAAGLHFTQLTATAEDEMAEAYGPEWETLFDRGNDSGY